MKKKEVFFNNKFQTHKFNILFQIEFKEEAEMKWMARSAWIIH